jgi:ATP-dependent DNA ligase
MFLAQIVKKLGPPEGIVAKRLADPYKPRVRWLKIKNPDYSQKEGRDDLFNGPPRSAR